MTQQQKAKSIPQVAVRTIGIARANLDPSFLGSSKPPPVTFGSIPNTGSLELASLKVAQEFRRLSMASSAAMIDFKPANEIVVPAIDSVITKAINH